MRSAREAASPSRASQAGAYRKSALRSAIPLVFLGDAFNTRDGESRSRSTKRQGNTKGCRRQSTPSTSYSRILALSNPLYHVQRMVRERRQLINLLKRQL